MMFRGKMVPGLVAFLSSVGFALAQTMIPQVVTGPEGLQKLRYGRMDLLAAGEGKLTVQRVEMREYRPPTTAPLPKGQKPVRGSDLPRCEADLSGGVYTFDPKTGIAEFRNNWGTVSCTYALIDNRLDMLVKIVNTSTNEIDGVELTLLKLLWPGKTGGTIDNDRVLGYLMASNDQTSVALCNWEASRPVRVSLAAREGQDQGAAISLVVPKEEWPHHPIVDDAYFQIPGRPIAPGASDQYHVSVHMGPADAGVPQLCKAMLDQFRKDRPMMLKWPDRRPIGRIFLANSWTQWKTNPRGYLFGKGQKNDVFTPEGLAEFRLALLASADVYIKNLKDNGAQGAIIWDLEGAEFWHPMTYIGNPHQMSLVSPEMERCADEFMRKFREAGLRVGVTLRPTEISLGGKPWTKFWHRDTKDPVEHLAAKIQYCKSRWGCTIFYLDSNVYGTYNAWDVEVTDKRIPWVMPTRILAEIAKRHPDVLIIPEHENAGYYAFAAPYKTQMIEQYASNPNAQAIWPESFSVVISDERTMEYRWEPYLAACLRGDVLFTEAFYTPLYNVYVRLINEEAGYLKTGWPKALVDRANAKALFPLTQDPDARTRYHAARALGQIKRPDAVVALGAMLGDSNLVVRKAALVALGQGGRLDDPQLIASLAGMLRNPDKTTGFLKVVAAETLGAAGEPAVGPLVDLLNSKEAGPSVPSAIRALGLTRTKNPSAHEAVVVVLKDPKRDYWTRLLACRAAGEAKMETAVEPLLACLPAGNEDLTEAAIIALGQIGDPRAIQPLVSLFDRKFNSWTRMRIPQAMDNALRQLTGKDLNGKDAWRALIQPAGLMPPQ